jgi:hypothetical protein
VPLVLAAASVAACGGGGGDSTGPKAAPATKFSFADPAGDTVQHSANDTVRAVDVLSLRGSVTRDTLVVSIHLAEPPRAYTGAPGDSGAFVGALELDTDENTSTGFSTFAEDAGLALQDVGVDYLVLIIAAQRSPAVVLDANNPTQGIQTGVVRYAADSIVVALPLSALGQDDGKFSMVGFVTTWERLADTTAAAEPVGLRMSDIFPNGGHYSIHLGGSASQVSARVVSGAARRVRLPRLTPAMRRLLGSRW